MQKISRTLWVVFVVSWATGTQYQAIPCIGKEEPDTVCAKGIQQRAERKFKTEEAAKEFSAVLTEAKFSDVKIDKK